jgi:hypothetical protein
MKTLLLAAMTLQVAGTTTNEAIQPIQPIQPILAQAQTLGAASIKKTVVFACDMKAMTAAQRRRQSGLLLPALKSSRLSASELEDGFAFRFPADAKTFATVSEWMGNERLCCPFFAFDLHVGDSTGPTTLRITGPEGVKRFIRAELPGLVD